MAAPTQMQLSTQTVEVIPCEPERVKDSWGFRWPVMFKIDKPESTPGWIVQKVIVRYRTWIKEEGKAPVFYSNKILLDGDSFRDKPEETYWEAWPVPANQTYVYWPSFMNPLEASERIALFPDEYLVAPDPQVGEQRSKGEVKVLGTVAFYLGDLPATFSPSTDSSAGILPKATKQPDFWTGTGTAHNLTATWNSLEPKGLMRLQMEPAPSKQLNPTEKLDWTAW